MRLTERMMRKKTMAAALALAWGGSAVASGHVMPALAALDLLEQGQWQLREPAGGSRLVCLGDDASPVLQLQHGSAACSHFVLQNDPHAATVNYSCPGIGRGQTTVTVETPRLFHIHTQGMAGGAPFDLTYEARKVGSCAVAAH